MSEPWTETRDVYVKRAEMRVSGPSVRKTRKLALLVHKDYVRKALQDGLFVPPEVLADYPNLAARLPGANPGVRDNPDYSGEHSAPMSDGGAPLHDLHNTYPDDIYSFGGARMYGDSGGDSRDRESINIIQATHRHPAKVVRIYRAIPKDAPPKINTGDWVTINRAYAKDHGEAALRGQYRVVSLVANARDLFTDGNSIHEWGYDPQLYNGDAERHWKGARLARKAGDVKAAEVLEAEARRLEGRA